MLRTFLLTLAVVDDLLAIIVIAVFYTPSLRLLPLVGAALAVAVFGLLVQRGVRRWWLLLPLAIVTWGLVHASGVHATVAGVLLAFTVPVRATGDGRSTAERLEHLWRPVSTGFAVPVFAFFAAGVSLAGATAGPRSAFSRGHSSRRCWRPWFCASVTLTIAGCGPARPPTTTPTASPTSTRPRSAETTCSLRQSSHTPRPAVHTAPAGVLTASPALS